MVPDEYNARMNIKYTFENKAMCAFGNMASAMSLFGDEYASQFFFDNKESDLDKLKEKFTKSGTEVAYNSFH